MDITMIGLQNAGKTSLLRVLAVRLPKTISNLVIAQNTDSSATNRAVNSHSSTSHCRAIDPFALRRGPAIPPPYPRSR